jgi:PAS domain-containing protein
LIFWTVISIGCLVAATLLAYLRIIAPVRELRAALRNLARGDLRAAPLSPRGGFLAEAFGDIRRISNLLQQFERQISDEGFSLKAILSSMVEGVVITDQSQRIQLANESLQRVFGLMQSPVNRTVLEAFFNHELQRAVDQTLSDGLPRKIEISLETIAREG